MAMVHLLVLEAVGNCVKLERRHLCVGPSEVHCLASQMEPPEEMRVGESVDEEELKMVMFNTRTCLCEVTLESPTVLRARSMAVEEEVQQIQLPAVAVAVKPME